MAEEDHDSSSADLPDPFSGSQRYVVPLKGLDSDDEAGPPSSTPNILSPPILGRRRSSGPVSTFDTPKGEYFSQEARARQGKRMERRGSLTKIESEQKLRHSLASVNEYHDESTNIQDLKESIERRGSIITTARSKSSQSMRDESMIGSVVETNFSDELLPQSDTISDTTNASIRGREEIEQIHITEVHHSKKRLSRPRKGLERDQLIETLVNFSSHVSTSVLEDLLAHGTSTAEEDDLIDSERQGPSSDDASLSSLSSGGLPQSADKTGSDKSVSDKSVVSDESVSEESSNEARRRVAQMMGYRSSLPPRRERESALLFVDITGFTKLSTVLEVESLSKVINSYFEMIVSEVTLHGGDVLKFAGDAFFAEWRGPPEESLDGSSLHKDGPTGPARPIDKRVWQACRCAASIVEKYSNYHVAVDSNFADESQAILDVHCGIGAGRVVGFHVSDFQEDQEDIHADPDAIELRREFLVVGDAIDQVSRAAHLASNGEVVASPEAIRALSRCCDMPERISNCLTPVYIVSKKFPTLSLQPRDQKLLDLLPKDDSSLVSVTENIKNYIENVDQTTLLRLRLQLALYVHPVVRGDEMSRSTVVDLSEPLEPENRHVAQAELRSVYTMFINVLIPPVLIGDPKVDSRLFQTLRNVMQVTSRELDRYSGQLRQFIVDDKGVVLIATFGLRGSTFPNLVANNGLPATFSIHKALKEELGVDNRIGATFGEVYCGVVGGMTRHEFSVLGAAVNLAARLMTSPINNGILVDGNVSSQADARFAFQALQPIKTKGYDRPVPTFEPLHAIQPGKRRGTTAVKFTGRQEEKSEILGFAKEILDNPEAAPSSVIGLIGESGMGKSALGVSVIAEARLECLRKEKEVISLRCASRESDQRIPMRTFRKILLGAIRELCEHDGSIKLGVGEYLDKKYFSAEESDTEENLSGTERSVDSAHNQPTYERMKYSRLDDSLAPLLSPKRTTTASLDQPFARRSSRTETSGRRRSSQTGGTEPAGRRRSSQTGGLQKMWRRSGGRPSLVRRDSNESVREGQVVNVPYMEKLEWACEETGYSPQYANLVGARFLGLESARPVTHIGGKVPAISDLVEFVAHAFMKITDYADLVLVFIDDFQWVDSFTWKVIKALGHSTKKMVVLCAMRSHDKQAMRRISTSVNFKMEITLGPLELPDIKELAEAILRYPAGVIDEHLCNDIFEMTGGVPVFVIELLEDVKRNRTAALNEEGKLRLNDSHIARKGKGNTALVEALLHRFDSLDARVRKVLQTCAVLGNSFAYSDLIRVHRDMDEEEIDEALNTAANEMILIEIADEEADGRSVMSSSTGESSSRNKTPSLDYSGSDSGYPTVADRYFEFSHDMWRSNVLKTMLKERKIELHRQIALSMESDKGLMIRRNDISRLLTLYDHWKLCGEFRKAAPLALTVGSKLHEWDLQPQSAELYLDTLEICYESVHPVDKNTRNSDENWVEVASDTDVLDSILRLHIRIAEVQRSMGKLDRAAAAFRDAYTILRSSTRRRPEQEMPILSGLCTLQFEMDPDDTDTLLPLIKEFRKASEKVSDCVHLLRALSLEAAYFAQHGEVELAIKATRPLQQVYKIEEHSQQMVRKYGKDYALECLSQSILWYALAGDHENASKQADIVLSRYLPYQDPNDIDSIMALILPAVLSMKGNGRALEAEYIMKKHVVNAYHHIAEGNSYWVEMFNPICYLLEITKMEEKQQFDEQFVEELEDWVLEIANNHYTAQHLRLGHTIMGEICFRLGRRKQTGDPLRGLLFAKSKLFLTPIARDKHAEPFLAHSAFQLLRAL